VLRWWLVPLGAALALLAGSALAALVVIRVAELTHAADAYLGMLLAGSAAPLLAAALAARRLLARRPPRPTAVPRRPASPRPTRRPSKPLIARGGAA
jgi:predicted lysophospholipase L1 biosynthesis ABC-type transport system permease subunit